MEQIPRSKIGETMRLSVRLLVTVAVLWSRSASADGTVITAPTGQKRITGTCALGSSIRVVNADGTVACETDDGEVYTAGSGLTLLAGVFAIDPTYAQRRVSGTCAAGSSIATIAQDGTVTCEADTDTTYTAGDGLTLTLNDFDVAAGTGITITGDAVTLNMTAASCSAGSFVSAITATGGTTCTAEVGDISNVSVSGPISGGGASGSVTIGMTNADYGDITLSGGTPGSTWTIDNDAVTYAKIQNVTATDRLLGRDTAGAGDIEELTVSGGLEFTGTGIQRSALTGDVTASAGSNATTIANSAVTLAKMADVATARILGRVTAGTGVVESLTGTQATTLLDSYTGSSKGLVPAGAGSTTKYLREDGTWTTISGGGITNSAGANVVMKSDGTNAVASTITDNGTIVTMSKALDQVEYVATDTIFSHTGGGTAVTVGAGGGLNVDADLTVDDDATITDTFTVNGITSLGDATTDTTTTKGNLLAVLADSGTDFASGGFGGGEWIVVGPNASNLATAGNLGFGYSTTSDEAQITAVDPSSGWKRIAMAGTDLAFLPTSSPTNRTTISASGVQTYGAGDLISGDDLTVADNATLGDAPATDLHVINGRWYSALQAGSSGAALTTSGGEVNVTANSLITFGESAAASGNPAITMYRTSAGLRTGTGVRLLQGSSTFSFAIQEGTNATAYGSETYTDRLFIAAGGNVGIGDSTPTEGHLVIGDGVSSKNVVLKAGTGWADYEMWSGSSNGGSILWSDDSGSTNAGEIFYYHGDDSMTFRTATAVRMTMVGGSVNIGTDTTPDFTLAVEGTLGVDGDTTLGDTAGDSHTWNGLLQEGASSELRAGYITTNLNGAMTIATSAGTGAWPVIVLGDVAAQGAVSGMSRTPSSLSIGWTAANGYVRAQGDTGGVTTSGMILQTTTVGGSTIDALTFTSTGNATFVGSLTVAEAISDSNGDLQISDAVGITGNLYNSAAGILTIADGLNVTGAGDFDTTLNVDGASTLVGAVTTGALNGYTQITQAADQDVTNAGVTDSNTFLISTTAGKVYAIDGFISAGGSNATGDYIFDWAVAAGTMDCAGTEQSLTTADAIQNTVVIATAAANTGSTSVGTRADASIGIGVRFNLVCKVGNTTTLKYRFGNAAAAGGRTSRTQAGSYIRWKQLN